MIKCMCGAIAICILHVTEWERNSGGGNGRKDINIPSICVPHCFSAAEETLWCGRLPSCGMNKQKKVFTDYSLSLSLCLPYNALIQFLAFSAPWKRHRRKWNLIVFFRAEEKNLFFTIQPSIHPHTIRSQQSYFSSKIIIIIIILPTSSLLPLFFRHYCRTNKMRGNIQCYFSH